MRLEQLMRFFDPKLARKLDDTNEVSYLWSSSDMAMVWLPGFLLHLPVAICAPRIR